MSDYGTTWDGVTITPGLIVFTNEYRVGKVVEDSLRDSSASGWFDVEYRNGSRVMQNAERVATHFTGRNGREVAADVYRVGHDWIFPSGERFCTLCRTTDDTNPVCLQAATDPVKGDRT